MQIIPTISADKGFSIFGGMYEEGQKGNDFMLAMQDALDAVRDGEEVSVSAALRDDSKSQPLVESPYSRNTTDGVTYTLSEVCFTKSELHELRQQLIKEGAPVESLKQFDVLADQPDGATLAQVLASLMGKTSTPNLGEDDIHAITALLGQIDPSGQLASDAIALMQQGNGPEAYAMIQNSLGKMASDSRIDLDRDSLIALGKGLGLNTDSLNGIVNNMGAASSVRIDANQFDALMSPAKNQFMSDAANAQKLDAALEKTLKPIISKARDRMEKEKLAGERESRRVQQTKVLIDKTVQKTSREIMDETVAANQLQDGQSSAIERQLDGKQSAMVGHAGKSSNKARANAGTDAQASRAQATTVKNAENADKKGNAEKIADNSDKKNIVQSAFADETAKVAANRHMAEDSTDQENNSGLLDHGKNQQDIWQELLGKIETRPTSSLTNIGSATSFVYSMLQGNLQAEILTVDEQISQNMPQLPQQVANQVEQGMLSAMRDGATRLDLQLHPAELGAITITLVARNGEVTAQIRSEKTETVEIINRQMDTIRVNLEQQGVKIDKIEVQLETKQDNGQNTFADLGQHNARQEEDARRQEMTRMRNLASMRNNKETSEDSILAQPLHIIGQSARYAGQALHVVA